MMWNLQHSPSLPSALLVPNRRHDSTRSTSLFADLDANTICADTQGYGYVLGGAFCTYSTLLYEVNQPLCEKHLSLKHMVRLCFLPVFSL